jgi:hypothetical protein
MAFMKLFRNWIEKEPQAATASQDLLAKEYDKILQTQALLNQKHQKVPIQPSWSGLAELKAGLESTLTLLREEWQEVTGGSNTPSLFRLLGVQAGEWEEATAKTKQPYLFLRLPGKPGFLIEPSNQSKLDVYLATQANPLLTEDSEGQTVKSAFFSRRSATLFQMEVLEEGLWRFQDRNKMENDKTSAQVLSTEELTATLIGHALGTLSKEESTLSKK